MRSTGSFLALEIWIDSTKLFSIRGTLFSSTPWSHWSSNRFTVGEYICFKSRSSFPFLSYWWAIFSELSANYSFFWCINSCAGISDAMWRRSCHCCRCKFLNILLLEDLWEYSGRQIGAQTWTFISDQHRGRPTDGMYRKIFYTTFLVTYARRTMSIDMVSR